MPTWVEIDTDARWYEQPMLHCDLCGRMIAKHVLRAEIEGETRTFCGEGCARLYENYWLAERRDAARSESIGETYARLMVE